MRLNYSIKCEAASTHQIIDALNYSSQSNHTGAPSEIAVGWPLFSTSAAFQLPPHPSFRRNCSPLSPPSPVSVLLKLCSQRADLGDCTGHSLSSPGHRLAGITLSQSVSAGPWPRVLLLGYLLCWGFVSLLLMLCSGPQVLTQCVNKGMQSGAGPAIRNKEHGAEWKTHDLWRLKGTFKETG